MDEKLLQRNIENYKNYETDALLGIWRANDKEHYSEEIFEAIRQILENRNCPIPPQTEGITTKIPDEEEIPFLSIVFFILSGLGLLGGIILCVQLWPGEPRTGYEWKTIVYIPSIIWLTVGIVESALFGAMGQVLIYLKKIVKNTKRMS